MCSTSCATRPACCGSGSALEGGAVEERVAVGGRRQRRGGRWRRRGQVAVLHPQRQPAGGRRVLHHALDRARAAVRVQRDSALSHRRPSRSPRARYSGGRPGCRASRLPGRAPARCCISSSIASVCASRIGSGTGAARSRATARRSRSARASVGASAAGGQQAVDHAVQAVQRARQQRRGLGAGRGGQQPQHVDAGLDLAQHAEELGRVGRADAALHEHALRRLGQARLQHVGDVLPAARAGADQVVVGELRLACRRACRAAPSGRP